MYDVPRVACMFCWGASTELEPVVHGRGCPYLHWQQTGDPSRLLDAWEVASWAALYARAGGAGLSTPRNARRRSSEGHRDRQERHDRRRQATVRGDLARYAQRIFRSHLRKGRAAPGT